jgi:hypothetical protein
MTLSVLHQELGVREDDPCSFTFSPGNDATHMSLISRITRFARSPHARRMANEAMRYGRSPQGRAKLQQVQRQLASRRRRRVR